MAPVLGQQGDGKGPREGRPHRQEALKGVNLGADRRREEGAGHGQGLGTVLLQGHGLFLLDRQARDGPGAANRTESAAVPSIALGVVDRDRIGRRARVLMDLEAPSLAEIGAPGALVVLVFRGAAARLGGRCLVKKPSEDLESEIQAHSGPFLLGPKETTIGP